ncbi:hypothetical protein [Plantactinospora sp. WMMB782]|uniref:hypothetical protein n=1 Tax=Plantactinospora sp. WMMB782 TaxID=3404121 RepID=UPI003B95FEE5
MAEPQVLILALDGSRRLAVLADVDRVLAAGGSATLVVSDIAKWRREKLPKQLRTVDLTKLELRLAPLAVEQLVLFRAPGLLFRAAGRGALAGRSKKANRAYQRGFADRVHRRVGMPVYRRLFQPLYARKGDPRLRLLDRYVLQRGRFDVLVVADPGSMPAAATILASLTARGAAPTLCFDAGAVLPAPAG